MFHRAAETLAEEKGYSGYLIVSYSEGLESGPLLDQRVSRGVVLLTGPIPIDTAAVEISPGK